MNTYIKDCFILILGLGLLFSALLGRVLSVPDEGRYVEIPREMTINHDYITPRINQVKYLEKPPLFYWLQAGAINLFRYLEPNQSIPEWVVRIPNLLIALFGCTFLYVTTRLLFDRLTGYLSALILGTSALYSVLARFVTLDMTVSVLISACLLSFLVADSTKSRIWLYCSYIFSALAVLTKGLIGILLPGIVIIVWMLLTNQIYLLKKIHILRGILLFLMITLPWHVLVQIHNPEFFNFYIIEQQFLRYFTTIAHRYQPPWFFIPIVLIGLLPWFFLLPQAIWQSFPKNRAQIATQSKPLFFLLWAGILFCFFSYSQSKLIPYILPVFPAISVLIGRYLANLSQADQIDSGLRWGLISFPILILLTLIGGLIWFKGDLNQINLTILLGGVGLMILSGIIPGIIALKFKRIKPAIYMLALLGGLSNSVLLYALKPISDHRSIKPLANVLKTYMHPRDQIFSYATYYQDLPFYLNKTINVVDYLGELEFGVQQQPETRRWMISKEAFLARWQLNQRSFMLTSNASYSELQKEHLRMYLLDRANNQVLVSNQP
jgi:4-amino-4-deoxy-L-arabinose transferase-like glycosyltransferase